MCGWVTGVWPYYERVILGAAARTPSYGDSVSANPPASAVKPSDPTASGQAPDGHARHPLTILVAEDRLSVRDPGAGGPLQ